MAFIVRAGGGAGAATMDHNIIGGHAHCGEPLGFVRFLLNRGQTQALCFAVLLSGKPLHTFPEAL